MKVIIWLFIAGCAICAFTDAAERIIPNIVTLPLFIIGWLYSWQAGVLKESAIFFLVLSVIGIIGFSLGGIGGGDVKMMSVLGIWLGPVSLLVLTGASIAGIIWSVIKLARKGDLVPRIKTFGKQLWLLPSHGLKVFKVDSEVAQEDVSSIPFGTFMGFAVILSFLVFQQTLP